MQQGTGNPTAQGKRPAKLWSSVYKARRKHLFRVLATVPCKLALDEEGVRELIACLGDDGNLDTSAATMRKQWPTYSPTVQVLKDLAETLNDLHKRNPDDKEGHIKAMTGRAVY
eukprot:37865-Eustigmatos_ZCMA.PRE.1